MTIGEGGRVTAGLPNRIRTEPEDGEIIGRMPAGSEFTILDGPICGTNDGLTWWQVDYNGLVGWTAEGENENYWLEPTE